jgi:hypothetical protein
MRTYVLLGSIIAATGLTMPHARAGFDGCCVGAPFFSAPVYASPPVAWSAPYDAPPSYYVVNQGPQLAGFVPPYARATYAIPDRYPYVHSYGIGMRYRYRAFRPPVWGYYGGVFARPYGPVYRAAPGSMIVLRPEY